MVTTASRLCIVWRADDTGEVRKGRDGDTIATITHEGISWTVRMVTPYRMATSRGFAYMRDVLRWVRGQLRRVNR
jgi:hypothetical protein